MQSHSPWGPLGRECQVGENLDKGHLAGRLGSCRPRGPEKTVTGYGGESPHMWRRRPAP